MQWFYAGIGRGLDIFRRMRLVQEHPMAAMGFAVWTAAKLQRGTLRATTSRFAEYL